MVCHSPPAALLPRDVVAATMSRLGTWESSVESPYWTAAPFQLHLPPDPRSEAPTHCDSPEQRIRFRGVERERQFWLEHLREVTDNESTHERFRSCGDVCWVEQDQETGRFYLTADTCKLRVCPACRRRIKYRTSDRVLDYFRRSPLAKWQFHTFTLKHSEFELSTQLDHLTASFRKLRQRSLWRKAVKGGYAVIEVTFHAKGTHSPTGRIRQTDEWHPHLHVLAETDWIDWSKLRKDWLACTGGSDNIDCQHVRSAKAAAHYVAKYIGTPPEIDFTSHVDAAHEWYHALNHRRLLIPFGPPAKVPKPEPKPQPPTERICRLADLQAAARNGNYPAQSILTRLIYRIFPPPKHRNPQAKLPFPKPTPEHPP